MADKLKVFNGLYGDQTFSPLFDFIHIELLETRSKTYNWEIQEHLHTDLVQLFLIEEGKGVLFSEKIEYVIQGPTIVFIPSNTLHGFRFTDTLKGEVITLAPSFVQNGFLQTDKNKNDFEQIDIIDFGNLRLVFKEIIVLKNSIKTELLANNTEKQAFLNLLFKTLFFGIFRFKNIQNILQNDAQNKTLKYFKAFQENVLKNYKESKSIADYARDLGISTMHLNRICRSVLNKSPIQIVHEQLILNAKKYLLNTSYSISEIAYFLNMSDPAYFTRVFKKNVGVSPKEFRKN